MVDTECCEEETVEYSAECPQNVGYRLGLRNVLSERRKRVADYSLICALFGLVIVIIETELSLAQLYDKVCILSFSLHLDAIVLSVLVLTVLEDHKLTFYTVFSIIVIILRLYYYYFILIK